MRSTLGALVGLLLVASCGGETSSREAPDGVIERDLFVQTYVEIRMTALYNGSRTITPAQKEEVLAERGVSEDDLRLFIETHGPDLAYMRDLWADIEAEILSLLSPDAEADSGRS